MTKKLLITGSTYIFDAHIKLLQEAGYEVSRLETSTEESLIEALKGVSVYILGGYGQVTEAVLASTDTLKTIIFCGVDYDNFIPAADAAREKGIQLLNAPGANAIAVAEFALGVAITMQREVFGLSRAGNTEAHTTKSIQGSVVGVIGGGHVAQAIIKGVQAFSPREIIYANRSVKDIPERHVPLEELVSTSDIIFVTLPLKAGMVLNKDIITKVKTGCLIISMSPMGLIDFEALLPRLESGELRAAVDWPAPSPAFEALPLDTWFHVRSHSAYNTEAAIQKISDDVTRMVIGLKS